MEQLPSRNSLIGRSEVWHLPDTITVPHPSDIFISVTSDMIDGEVRSGRIDSSQRSIHSNNGSNNLGDFITLISNSKSNPQYYEIING